MVHSRSDHCSDPPFLSIQVLRKFKVHSSSPPFADLDSDGEARLKFSLASDVRDLLDALRPGFREGLCKGKLKKISRSP